MNVKQLTNSDSLKILQEAKLDPDDLSTRQARVLLDYDAVMPNEMTVHQNDVRLGTVHLSPYAHTISHRKKKKTNFSTFLRKEMYLTRLFRK